MYQAGQGHYPVQSYRDDDGDYGNQSYGYNYRNYRMPNETGIKGKIEQKYWRSKQKVIEKLGKDQDEHVIAGDAEVDARLEAFRHIKMTCIQLMAAIEFYQNKIFALSQDENEMGRFLRDQGTTDKTKAGKMMIAVGKAQSFAAQQRLCLRSSLARLHAELETFRFRAIQDTQLTVDKMEQARSDYRARLLWMADVSKELDPDHYKRLDKFRDVQFQVKAAKKLFDKLKGDVIQKIDLLSASRCNLLSATLEPYQAAMVKFLRSTAKSYNEVYQQYQGHPSYQFNILKHIIPNNGIVDDDDEEVEEKRRESRRHRNKKTKAIEPAKEVTEQATEKGTSNVAEDKLISFDSSPSEENSAALQHVQSINTPQQPQEDLLGGLHPSEDISPGFGDYASDERTKIDESGFEDLLGKFEENNLLAGTIGESAEPSLFGDVEGGSVAQPKAPATLAPSVDDLLFGSPLRQIDDAQKSDLDILSDVLNNQSLGITEREHNDSFSGQWQSMFGAQDVPDSKPTDESVNSEIDVDTKSDQMFMPSFLLDQMRKADPVAMTQGAPKGFTSVKDSDKVSKTPPQSRKSKKKEGKDMSAWFNLFADLDPLANPDEVGATAEASDGKQAC